MSLHSRLVQPIHQLELQQSVQRPEASDGFKEGRREQILRLHQFQTSAVPARILQRVSGLVVASVRLSEAHRHVLCCSVAAQVWYRFSAVIGALDHHDREREEHLEQYHREAWYQGATRTVPCHARPQSAEDEPQVEQQAHHVLEELTRDRLHWSRRSECQDDSPKLDASLEPAPPASPVRHCDEPSSLPQDDQQLQFG